MTPVEGPDAKVFPWRMVIALGVIVLIAIAVAVLLRLFRLTVVEPVQTRFRSWFGRG